MASSGYSLVPASYVYLLRDDAVLLQRRRGTGYADGSWAAGAAGHIEAGETALAAAVREVREELDVIVASGDLVPITVMQRTDGTSAPREQRVDWFFSTRAWRGSPRIAEPTKCADQRWFPLDELPPEVPDYERVVLDGLRFGSLPPVSSFGFPPG